MYRYPISLALLAAQPISLFCCSGGLYDSVAGILFLLQWSLSLRCDWLTVDRFIGMQ